MSSHDGLLLIDKQPDGTSHDVVQRVRRALQQKKIGHCGTLDPTATGLLVLTLGKATRLTRFLIRAPKVYQGAIRFGIATDTYDAAGQTMATHAVPSWEDDRLATEMQRFVGEQQQTAPPYSAKKAGGRKYYEMARKGEEVPVARKSITIYDFQALGPLENDLLPFELACTSGTYVRTVAHELGEALGCGAHLASLRRTKVGPFLLENATLLSDLETAEDSAPSPPAAGWIPFDEIPLPFERLITDRQQEQRIRHGQTLLSRDLTMSEGDWVKLVNERNELIGVGTVTERIGAGGVGVIQPRIVFT